MNITDDEHGPHDAKRQTLKHSESLHGDALDRELDAALAKYATVDPRSGLEQRVLARLHSERHVGNRSWWGWPAVGALSAVVVVVVALLGWRSVKPARDFAKHHPPIVLPNAAGTNAVSNKGSIVGPSLPTQNANPTIGKRRRETETAAAPKLDVFPSPLPLNEQEKMLASYVSEYPKEAALVAQARTEALRRDNEEERTAQETNNAR